MWIWAMGHPIWPVVTNGADTPPGLLERLRLLIEQAGPADQAAAAAGPVRVQRRVPECGEIMIAIQLIHGGLIHARKNVTVT